MLLREIKRIKYARAGIEPTTSGAKGKRLYQLDHGHNTCTLCLTILLIYLYNLCCHNVIELDPKGGLAAGPPSGGHMTTQSSLSAVPAMPRKPHYRSVVFN